MRPTHRRFRIALPALLVPLALQLGAAAPAAPAEVPPQEPPAVTVVVLPPRVVGASDAETRAATELLADRLAERLAAVEGIRVVDRTQLDRVLLERRLAEPPAGRMLAYDLMLRLEIDPLRAEPEARLALIDLSTGNAVAAGAFPWQADTAADPPAAMVDLCRSAAARVAAGLARRLKVRLLGVATPDDLARLGPLAEHLGQVLEQVIERSGRGEVVRHLEAMTAKEESLLLLMDLSRLPGGRRFLPQADATLEAELREREAQGRTFDETTVEIRLRLRGSAGGERLATASGTVARWPHVVRQAGEKLAEWLGEADAAPLAEHAAEMARRRRQAEAEVEAALREAGRDRKPALARVAAAAKLDPTYEPAAYWLVETCCFAEDAPAGTGGDAAARTIREALHYLRSFRGHAAHRQRVLELAYYAANGIDARARKRPEDGAADFVRLVDAFREIVDIGLAGPIREYAWHCGWSVPIVHRAMAAADVPAERRRRWLDRAIEQADRLAADVERVDHFHRRNVSSSFLKIRAAALGAAVEDREPERARRIVGELMDRRAALARDSWDVLGEVRRAVARMDDAALLAKFDAWARPLLEPVDYIHVRWPQPEVYPGAAPPAPARPCGAMTPLAIHSGRLYGVRRDRGETIGYRELTGWMDSSKPQSLVYLALDGDGRPAGTVTALPRPEVRGRLAATSAAGLGDTVFFGTKQSGLLAFDAKTEAWAVYGAEQGLPDLGVWSVHPLDGETLLCVGGKLFGRGLFYTFDVRTKAVRLLHRTDRQGRAVFWTLDRVWRDGDRLLGINYLGLGSDVLGPKPAFRDWPDQYPYGWRRRPDTGSAQPTSLAETGPRRWIMSTAGLHEVAADGRILRSWWNPMEFSAGRRAHANLAHDDVATPAGLPARGGGSEAGYEMLAQDAAHLFLAGRSGILCYDPRADTWYGPLAGADGAFALAGARGAWLSGRSGMVYVETSDFIEASRRAGRAVTSDEFLRRQREVAAAAGPLEAAKFAFARRSLDEARRMLEEFLAKEPDHPEALLLMGKIHDLWCLDRPEEALAWYRRLAALEDDPKAVYTGLYEQFVLHHALGRWDEAIAVGEAILDRFPRIAHGMTEEIDRFLDYCRRGAKAAKAAAKAPGGGDASP